MGYAFAEPPYLAALLQAGFDELTGVDLAEADVPGMTGVQADVRDLPFDDGASTSSSASRRSSTSAPTTAATGSTPKTTRPRA